MPLPDDNLGVNMRYIRVFQHSENYISLYYFLADSALHKFLKGMKAEAIKLIKVDEVPSYMLYDRIKRRVELINEIYGNHTIINNFQHGFSVIMPKEYLKWIENLFEGFEYEDTQVLNQIKATKSAARVS